MTASMMSIRIGDIVEFSLPSGKFGYAQYTHLHKGKPSHGQLLRILPGAYDERPADLAVLAQQHERFYSFFPVDQAITDGYIRIAGHAEVPDWALSFPRFRSVRQIDPKTKRVSKWWLWDGVQSIPIEEMTPDLAALSIRGRPTYGFLASRIDSNWKPEDDV